MKTKSLIKHPKQSVLTNKKLIRLLVIEDNRLLRDGIVALIERHSDIKVVGAVGDIEKTFQKIHVLKPHVVLLDLGLSNHSSLWIVKSVKKNFPELKIVVMDLVPSQADIFEFVQAGVSGFTLKDATVADLLRTVHAVSNGSKVLPPDLTESLFSKIVDQAIEAGGEKVIESIRMTKREREVIELITDGLTNKEIGQKLHLSNYTVKSHVHNILEKLALHNRVQIAIYANKIAKTAESISLIGE